MFANQKSGTRGWLRSSCLLIENQTSRLNPLHGQNHERRPEPLDDPPPKAADGIRTHVSSQIGDADGTRTR